MIANALLPLARFQRPACNLASADGDELSASVELKKKKKVPAATASKKEKLVKTNKQTKNIALLFCFWRWGDRLLTSPPQTENEKHSAWLEEKVFRPGCADSSPRSFFCFFRYIHQSALLLTLQSAKPAAK